MIIISTDLIYKIYISIITYEVLSMIIGLVCVLLNKFNNKQIGTLCIFLNAIGFVTLLYFKSSISSVMYYVGVVLTIMTSVLFSINIIWKNEY